MKMELLIARILGGPARPPVADSAIQPPDARLTRAQSIVESSRLQRMVDTTRTITTMCLTTGTLGWPLATGTVTITSAGTITTVTGKVGTMEAVAVTTKLHCWLCARRQSGSSRKLCKRLLQRWGLPLMPYNITILIICMKLLYSTYTSCCI